jgi:hypothetical protein
MFRAHKDHMKIEVAYDAGRVSITAPDDHTQFERTQRIIAQSERSLAQVYLDRQSIKGPLDALKAYFRRRGWLITKEGY